MNRTSVAVIIPTNRGGAYLRSAVESVRAQTVQPTEIILVDDGAPGDALGGIAAALGLTYLRQPASGISVARNTGVANCTAEWVTFLDDDDIWHPERLEAQLEALAACPAAIAAHTGGWFMDSAGVRIGKEWPAPAASAADLLAARVPPPRITTLLVRRDAYLAAGGCLRYTEPAEDNDLIMRLLCEGEFAAVDRPLVGYRRHAANVTARGLRGRRAALRSIRRLQSDSRARHDAETARLLGLRRRVVLGEMASENMGEAIESFKRREWSYLLQTLGWAMTAAPRQSVGDAARRLLSRGRRDR